MSLARRMRQALAEESECAKKFSALVPLMEEAINRIEHLEWACAQTNEDVCQALGEALRYPWFKDDQQNFPGATEQDGVCVGDHVAETLADEAAERIKLLERRLNQQDHGELL